MSDQFEKIRLDKQSNFFDDLQSSLQKNNFNNKSDESNDEMSDDDETQNKPKQMQSSMKNPYFEMDQQIKQEQQKVKQQNLKIIDKIQESEQIIDPNKVVYEKSSGQERRNTNYRMSQEDMKKMRRDLNQKQIGNEKMASRYMPLPKSPVTIKSRLFNMRGLFDLKILERLNAIVYDGTQVKKEFDKIQNNLMAHVRECSLASENIVQQLELKLNPKLNKEDFYESDDSHQIQEIINQFYEKHQSSIETMEYNLKLIRQALLQADNLKLEKKEIDLNLQYKIEVVNVKLELPCGYNDVVGKLDDYTLALSMGEDITDLVQFTKSEIDSKVVQIQNLLSIKEKINMVLVHEERIICDRFVYKSKNFELIQQLEHESPFQSGVALNRNCFMSGHMNSAKLAIWRWNGEHYQIIAKHAFMSGAHKHKVYQLEKDPYSSGNSVIMLTSNTLIQHINTIMSATEFAQSRRRVLVKDLHLLQAFKILSNEHILVIMKQAVSIYSLLTNRTIRTFHYNGLLSKRIISPANFNYESNALLYLLEDGKMKLLDLLNVGYKCSLDSVITHHVGTTVKLLEQKPKNPEEQFEQEEAQRREKGFFQGMNILGIFRNQQGYIGNSIIKIENI